MALQACGSRLARLSNAKRRAGARWITSGAMCMLSVAAPVFAAPPQPDAAPPDTQTQSPTTSKATDADTLPHVTVQAQREAIAKQAQTFVVVDLNQLQGMDWGQLADYIAMAALTNVDSYSNFGDMPSILALFSSAPEARPKGLTDWDSAYLKALYHTDRMSPQQRLSIAQQMARQLDPGK
jgi:hypothetical protein